jgi:hypothetical protein
MAPVTKPVKPDTKATNSASEPPSDSSLMMAATQQTAQAPTEQSSQPHHGRSDGLKGMAGSVAPESQKAEQTLKWACR